MTDDILNEEIRFCPSCGYEGTDFDCPACHIKMESQENEINKLAKEEKKDLLGEEVSLEAEQEKEIKEENREDKKEVEDDQDL